MDRESIDWGGASSMEAVVAEVLESHRRSSGVLDVVVVVVAVAMVTDRVVRAVEGLLLFVLGRPNGGCAINTSIRGSC